MKAKQICVGVALLTLFAALGGCSNGEPAAKTPDDVKAFKLDPSKMPPEARAQMQAARSGQPPAAAQNAPQGAPQPNQK
jgi:hypothetical protein